MSDEDILSGFDKKHLEAIWEDVDWEYMQEMNDTGEILEDIAISDEELSKITASVTAQCVLGKLYESGFR